MEGSFIMLFVQGSFFFILRLKRIFLLDSNIEKAYSGFCKINAELNTDGLPAYVDKAGGNRRVDSKI